MTHNPQFGRVRPTTWIECDALSDQIGARVVLAAETFQRTGSFKYRAAYHLASHVEQREIVTASSGNFGQAMALACRILGKSCIVVMPNTSAAVKVAAVRRYGGEVDLIDVNTVSRAERVNTIASTRPGAYVASAYDDHLVIEGNATLGDEIAAYLTGVDAVIAPVGGGGLTSGIITGLRRSGCAAEVWAAEPLLGNDAARSLRAGRVIANETEPQTIADGARTVSLGACNWAVLQQGLAGVVEVPENVIVEAVRLLFGAANLKVEPTGALGIGAMLAAPEVVRGRTVCCVVSGGNVDPGVYARLIV